MSAWFSGCYPTGNRNTTFKQLCNDIFYLVLCYTASSGKPSLWLRGFRELRPWEFMINEPLQDFLFSALQEVQWGQGCSKRSPGRVPKEIQLITRASSSMTLWHAMALPGAAAQLPHGISDSPGKDWATTAATALCWTQGYARFLKSPKI